MTDENAIDAERDGGDSDLVSVAVCVFQRTEIMGALALGVRDAAQETGEPAVKVCVYSITAAAVAWLFILAIVMKGIAS